MADDAQKPQDLMRLAAAAEVVASWPPLREDFIPRQDYVSAAVHELEKGRMWPRVWQMACRLEEIPNVGDFIVYDICDDSIIVARAAPDEIKAYYNVCPHRGRKLRDDKRGNLSNFWCRFHGWKFALDGQATYVHDEDDWARCATFSREQVGLKEVKVDTWGGWVWINQDPECEPLRQYLGEAADRLDPIGLTDCRRAWWKTLIAPVNWKVVVEAFNEGYHSYATHHSGMNYGSMRSVGRAAGRHGTFSGVSKGSLGEYRDGAGMWRQAQTVQEYIYAAMKWQFDTLHALTLEPTMAAAERLRREFADETDPAVVQQRFFDLQREETERRGAKWPELLTLKTAAEAGTDWHIFPHSICLPSVDGALWYRLRPNGDDPNSCIFDIWCFARYAPGAEPKVEQEIYQGFEAFRGQCFFLEEDFENMLAVHQGMKCRGWEGARTSPVQEPQIVNFHRSIREFIGRT
jgi:phenylpropionate dioxygenase-like ring-hydroxylating dioxygenase large terminal subunit